MKNTLWKMLSLFVLGNLLFGCSPAAMNESYEGEWIANLGKITFQQEGNTITGTIAGYGGVWNETFEGTFTGNQAVFDTEVLGGFTLIFDGDTFKSASPELGFCGIRANGENELPSGCGYSGKWIIPDKPGFPEGSYIELKQVEENVTGTFYDGDEKVYDTVSGTVYWGKGWMMEGTTEEHGKVMLDINSEETGFMIISDDFPFEEQFCAIREGQANAYMGMYYCE